MKIFVTGATGFIGSHFVNEAHASGYEIVALRRSQDSVPRVQLLKQPHWVTAALDAVDESIINGCEVIVHLAAHTANVPYDNLENCLKWNLIAPLRLFRKAVELGIDRILVAGSCFEYGIAGERYEFIPPDAPLEPTNSYAASKAAASIAFVQFARECKLRLSIHRFFQVYGDGEAENRFWPSLKRAAKHGEDFKMSQGEQIRDFVHVSDVAKELVKALSRNDLVHGLPVIENIGTGNPRTLRDFAEEWWQRFGATGNLLVGAIETRTGEIRRCVPKI